MTREMMLEFKVPVFVLSEATVGVSLLAGVLQTWNYCQGNPVELCCKGWQHVFPRLWWLNLNMRLINHLLLSLAESSICNNDSCKQSELGIGNHQQAVNSLRLHLCMYVWLWLCVWKAWSMCVSMCLHWGVFNESSGNNSKKQKYTPRDGCRDPPA